MASLGSKVLQIRSVEFAGKYRVPTRVLSSLTDPLIPLEEEMHSGTLITLRKTKNGSRRCLRHRLQPRRSQDHLAGRAGQASIAFSILGPVAAANIDVDMIVQNQSVAGDRLLVHREPQRVRARRGPAQARGHPGRGRPRAVHRRRKVAKVSIVGIGMRSHVGVASLMFQTLSQEGINIQMISTSEIKTSVIIDDKYMELGVRALHKAFGLDQAPAAKA